jgi:hypothetical protein
MLSQAASLLLSAAEVIDEALDRPDRGKIDD